MTDSTVVRMMNGDLIKFERVIDAHNLSQTIANMFEVDEWQVRLIKISESQESPECPEWFCWFDTEIKVKISLLSSSVDTDRVRLDGKWLSLVTNDSLISLLLRFVDKLPWLWTNPHPLVVAHIMSAVRDNGVHHLPRHVGANCSDDIVTWLISLPQEQQQRFLMMIFKKNLNPRARSWIYREIITNQLTDVNNLALYREMFKSSDASIISDVWERTERYGIDKLMHLPANDHETAVTKRMEFLDRVSPNETCFQVVLTDGFFGTRNEELCSRLLETVPFDKIIRLQCTLWVEFPFECVVDYVLENELYDLPKFATGFQRNPHPRAVDFYLTHPHKIDPVEFVFNTNPKAVKTTKRMKIRVDEILSQKNHRAEMHMLDMLCTLNHTMDFSELPFETQLQIVKMFGHLNAIVFVE